MKNYNTSPKGDKFLSTWMILPQDRQSLHRCLRYLTSAVDQVTACAAVSMIKFLQQLIQETQQKIEHLYGLRQADQQQIEALQGEKAYLMSELEQVQKSLKAFGAIHHIPFLVQSQCFVGSSLHGMKPSAFSC